MKRNNSFVLRLSKDELQRLDKAVKKTNCSREGYVRMLINGYEPQAKPPIEYYDVLFELRKIKAVMKKLAEAPWHSADSSREYAANVKKLGDICNKLQNAFVPIKRE